MSHLQDYVTSLTEFHETFLQPVVRSCADARFDKFPLRKTLIAEEFAEYMMAKVRHEVIDALGDLLYVTVGTMLTTGVLPHEYQERVSVTCTNTKLPLFSAVNKMLTVLGKEKPCYRGLWDATTGLYWKINDAAITYGFDLWKAFQLIHASNMTKLWPIEIYLSPEFDDETMVAHFRPNLNGYVVMRKSDEKVIKPSTYTPVNLTNL